MISSEKSGCVFSYKSHDFTVYISYNLVEMIRVILALMLRNRFHCTFIFTHFLCCFIFFFEQSHRMRIIFKQIYLTTRFYTTKYYNSEIDRT